MPREQRVQVRSVPSASVTAVLIRAALFVGIALATTACAQTVDGMAKAQANDEKGPKSEEDLKVQCWMAQEKQKNVNNIDAKIAAVDKCIAEGKKHLPPAG
jgi:hypothetical protein